MAALTRTCPDCGQDFWLTDEEQQFFERLAVSGAQPDHTPGWSLPKRCTPCRQARRRAREAVPGEADGWYEQTCIDCEATFAIGPKDVAYFKMRGWAWPRRCKPCRSARRQHDHRANDSRQQEREP